MPETLHNNDFSAGWCPSDDQVNGRPNGLLQMTNMDLDSNGALQLVKGTQVIWSSYTGRAFMLFSRFISGTRYDYAATGEPAIYRNASKIITGSDPTTAAFGTAFNFVLICSGNQRYKDNGSALVNLGVNPPTAAPTLTQQVNNAPWALIGQWYSIGSVPAGSITYPSGLYAQCTTNSNGIFVMQTVGGSAVDCTTLSGPGGSGISTDDDYVIISGYISNPYGVSLEFDVLLQPGDSAGDLVSDMYTFVVQDLSSSADFDTITGAFTIRIPRVNFAKYGGGAYDWTTVYGFRLTVNTGRSATEVINLWGPYQGQTYFVIIGGTSAQFGSYNYAQMNVNNTGSYLAKSILGPISKTYTINGLNALVTFQNPTSVDPQVNEVWIFRQGGNLGKWYRVKRIVAPFTPNPTYDGAGDQTALTIDITVDLNLTSIAAATISDNILDIVGPIQGRWYYFTPNFMYPSDVNDPDLINASQAVRTCGSASEQFMWARAVSASVVIVGTSVDCYLLTGTFSTFPDGTIDVYYQSLGVKFPPITMDATAYGGVIYYFAADGWRMLTPTSFGTTYSSQNNQLMVAPNLDKLYRGINCYGYTAVTGQAPNFSRSPLCVAKNKFFGFVPGSVANRCDVYDFARQYWRALDYNLGQVTACCATQDNKVLAFYFSDMKLREIEYYNNPGVDGGGSIHWQLLFPFKDNGKPRQRKDTYTFKSRLRTTVGSIQLSILDETGTTTAPVATLSSSTPNTTEQFLDLSAPYGTHLPKAYSVQLTGSDTGVVIEDWSIDYDPRPVPLTFLRVPANNYGTTARKRIYTVPFQCDTLGNTAVITPIVDGVTQAGFSFINNGKKGFYYLFNFGQLGTYGNQTVGRDYEWTINGNGSEFEFWGFEEIRNIEIFPDPCSCYVLPKGNFGSAVKKRFRTWPFIIDTRGNNVTFNALVDNQSGGTSIFNTNGERATVFHYFNTDVFGIDYGGYFTDPAGLLEIWQAPGIGGPNNPGIPPDSVENLPIYKEFDQVGPIEIFRFGKILRMALRCFSNGTPIPFNVFIGDVSVYTGNFNVTVGVEDEYIVDLPKGVSGTILRVELGPCNFTFARYFMKFQVAISAAQKDTELQWLTVPGVSSYMAGGV